MDNAFKFGEISVTCEGYDYPDDPYILKGSCGVSSVISIVSVVRYSLTFAYCPYWCISWVIDLSNELSCCLLLVS